MHDYISFSLVHSFSLTLPQCVFLSTSQPKSLFSSTPPLPLSPWLLSEQHLFAGISFSFSVYNHSNLIDRSFFFFLSLQPHQSLQDQSCFSLLRWLRHHCRCRSKITLSEFLLISLSTTTPTFLAEASSSFSLNNHNNLFKSKGR